VRGAKRDVLILLLATAAVIPAFTALKLSPILGFLLSGCVLGPNGLSLVSDVHTIEVLAEFGVVFFLFEMGARFLYDDTSWIEILVRLALS
jgi:CPA2 family monovalent cation:H+ antiporter-2